MKHILIVEDQADHAFLLQYQLNKLGFLTSVCTNPFAIMERIRHGFVDVVTVDLKMPEINGHDLIKYIRAIDRDILLIVITAEDNNEDRIKCLQAGANYYLVKPYDVKDLKQILKDL